MSVIIIDLVGDEGEVKHEEKAEKPKERKWTKEDFIRHITSLQIVPVEPDKR